MFPAPAPGFPSWNADMQSVYCPETPPAPGAGRAGHQSIEGLDRGAGRSHSVKSGAVADPFVDLIACERDCRTCSYAVTLDCDGTPERSQVIEDRSKISCFPM